MKKTILLALVLILYISCNSKEDSDQTEEPAIQTQTELLTEQMQGEYQACIVSPGYGLPYYSQISVSVVDSVMTKTFTLSSHSNCSSPVYSYEIISEISLASKLTESPLKVAVDLKIVSYKFTDLHGWYSTQNYCGLTDWALGVEKDVTGLTCPSLNSSPAGSTYLSAGGIDFESVIIGTNSLSIVADENETGRSDLTRKLTGLAEITKI